MQLSTRLRLLFPGLPLIFVDYHKEVAEEIVFELPSQFHYHFQSNTLVSKLTYETKVSYTCVQSKK